VSLQKQEHGLPFCLASEPYDEKSISSSCMLTTGNLSLSIMQDCSFLADAEGIHALLWSLGFPMINTIHYQVHISQEEKAFNNERGCSTCFFTMVETLLPWIFSVWAL
jgi:hypothetical protein